FALNHPTIEDMVTELEKEAPTMPLNTDPVSMGGEEAIITSPQDIKYVEASAEPIAIISTASQLPGDLNTPDSLWRGVSSGLDAITEVPKSRFDIDAVYSEDPHGIGVSNTRKGGFISEAEYFDYTLFDIQKAEALVMDPHQRLMLEVGYQAFHSAGYDRRSLKGKRFGVFVGMANQDWMVSQGQDNAHNPYFGVGVSLSIASNRISHLLGLNGPSMTLDTACSSSLVALDLAVSKLREHDCDAALVGGVNVMMHHRTFVGSSAANMLSVQGRCASFDAQADGYCRGE
ncbi:polyketide synthase, partial [Vibrio nigripulchritudo]